MNSRHELYSEWKIAARRKTKNFTPALKDEFEIIWIDLNKLFYRQCSFLGKILLMRHFQKIEISFQTDRFKILV